MKKVLSISIAAYNKEDEIKRAIESCLINNSQLLKLIEIIVVNDGSKDNTFCNAKKYEEKYSDIIRVIDKENGGYGSTVNIALQNARGKYFKLLDADDWYSTEQLELFVGILLNEDSDLVITNYSEHYKNKIKRIKYSDKEYDCNEIKKLNISIKMPGICYKTDILRDNNIRLSENVLYTDVEFVVYPLYFVNTIKFLPYDIYQYTLGNIAQSVSTKSRIEHLTDSKFICDKLIECYEMQGKNEDTIKLIENQIAESIKFYLTGLLLSMDEQSKELFAEFDNKLKRENKKLYQKTTNKILSIMRITRYRGYFLCGTYLKRIKY